MRAPRLGGTDEAYLLLECTVGIVAPMQVVVVLDDDPGPAVARDLVARLAGGPLDRAVRRPVVPGARPRWVRPPGAAQARVDPTPVDDAIAWARRHLGEAPLDVLGARGWQVATVALTDGGRAVSVVASHVLADGRRFVETVADAVVGESCGDADPVPEGTPRPLRRVAGDAADAATAVADAVRAAVHLVRGRAPDTPTSPPRRPAARSEEPASTPVDDAPTHHVVTLDRARWHAVAADLGGTATTLLVALGAGLARHSGVVTARGGPQSPVRLTLAVDRRADAHSSTANAADGVAIALPTDPTPDTGLAAARAAIRTALSDPPGDDALARVARLLPSSTLAHVIAAIPGPDVAVSQLGPAPEGLLAWRGTRARTVLVRAAARTAAPDLARRMLPGIAVWAVEHDDAITVSVCAVDPVARADLGGAVARELDLWGLRADVRAG
ncbi:hypothetical protein [uncultured Williamsia sp.]|uniref:hypothetical protein n=1 Tax=uncultured Williamsia sp. TaxID=259311 RepID=UPI0026101DF9|nr:hypothetical protein [uncultured Williamsia sp.]